MEELIVFFHVPDAVYFAWIVVGASLGTTYWHLHQASQSVSRALIYVLPTFFFSLIVPIGIAVLLHDFSEATETEDE